ncbi:anti-sigma factor family protein [Aneurinibacillus aneurinilyticus]|uniref:Anti-sigma-W factor RsiW n=2 Tax=Aneurinibacillus aneurinilyticus TaxID=1391 RepID=A0A848CT93_ANEAE|nr:zf-HC2 domain-containing protein [Aneurinibacillus aneurinilyticus]ERI07472.1 hypothetical protein HMPREF0083_04468 [Aneurinibacillus aneurinilyticus ATCC 12856]MCI1694573.1 zf-HC2 domain-containing protein [Aneurinibacillus aneurinilyticus]MED0672245.1 zf-HC2 domain-containing protein [Aneurinibacillus aneurinilyticus]MED0705850.1 zf-HC2 domain-containing protein [Aneurinibacillus aneurinilyticus]MED0724142.1 zf-HC2 domain-containing protein [Aneurinibacillus aneurinilyticus]
MKHMEEMISAYIDDELTDAERRLVETHINKCKECKKLVEDLSMMKNQVFTTYQSIEIPDNMEQYFLSSIEQKTQRGKNKIPWPIVIGSVILIILAVLCLSPLATFGVGLISLLFTIMMRLLQVASTFMAVVPSLFIGVIGFAVLLLLISVLSLRRLFLTKAIE